MLTHLLNQLSEGENMEKNKKRIFAYTMAKTMDNEDMMEVSGGGGVQMTVHPTMKTSSAGPGSFSDVTFDTSRD